MSTVKIPEDMSPWHCTVNGVSYTYPAGETLDVPEAVAEVIESSRRQFPGPKLRGKYALIEEITLAEDTAQILRSEEPDGTPYDFSAVLLKIVARKTAETGNTTMQINVNSTMVNYIDAAVSASDTVYSYAEYWGCNGLMRYRCTNGTANYGSNGIQRGESSSGLIREFSPIRFIKLCFPKIRIPAGTVVQIYAVRS